jgi:hypothetical protein
MAKSQTEDYLVKYGIVGEGHKSKAAYTLLKLQPSLEKAPYDKPSTYVSELWGRIEKSRISSSLNGTLFEYVLACVLIREGLTPFYMSAEVQFVPNARFDLLLYTKEIGPIVLSAKTSLRERYKQADLESQALKAVHRRSQTYLLTLNGHEAIGVQNKIKLGDVTNLEKVVVATTRDFDRLIQNLHGFSYLQAPKVPIIHQAKLIRA